MNILEVKDLSLYYRCSLLGGKKQCFSGDSITKSLKLKIPSNNSNFNSADQLKKGSGFCKATVFVKRLIFANDSDRIYKALQKVSIDIKKGQLICVIGPNGSGKTTFLRAVAGLEKPQSGKINLDGQCVFSVFDDDQKNVYKSIFNRQVGMVFQDLALFPHLKVKKNITYGLQGLNKLQKRHCYERLSEIIKTFKLDTLMNKYCHELSAGQKQRVAIARSIAPNPKILLMDEPFAHLDRCIAHQLVTDLRQLLKKLSISTIMVCHNHSYAKDFADQIAVMIDGSIRQYDDYDQVINCPKDLQVSEFVGSKNLSL